MNNNPIGFLDSGIGGLSVLKKAYKLLPNEDFVFFSDSAHNPYGDKSDEEIKQRCDKIVKYLITKKNCKAIVLACNTASAKAAEYLRAKYSNIPIIAIEPAYKMVHDCNPDGATIVMATKGTLESEKFHRLYKKYDNKHTKLLACVGMADIIEQDRKEDLALYLEDLLGEYKGKVQNIVLGCTHYPLAKQEIRNVLGDVKFFDGAEGVSRRLKAVLAQDNLLTESEAEGKITFLDSSETKEQRELKAKRFFNLFKKYE